MALDSKDVKIALITGATLAVAVLVIRAATKRLE